MPHGLALRRSSSFSLFAALLLSPSALLNAQAVNGTLLGNVTDNSGASVANAHITVTESATGVTQQTISNESGNYSLPGLQPGTYTVTVEAPGFKRDSHEHIDLLSNTSTRVDVALVTGSVTETVLVTTAPPLLQTDRADISTKIEAQQVANLPLGTNRNFQSLLNLVPGTTPATFQHSQFFNAQSALQTEANGIPRMGNLYQIEGIDDDERTGLLQIIIPPAEAIQSVDISTNNFEAELGRAIGAVTNVTLKSGTNAFHGSAFEFIQNNAVNARSFFATTPLGHLSYNYFGGSIGGPIIKDKLFFFGDYLRTVDHESISNTFSLPPTAFYIPNAAGFIDLSGPLTSSRGQVYDPATGSPDGSNRTPFAGNRIPISRVNPTSLALLKLLPAPNQNQSNLSNPSNNYGVNLPFQKTTDSYDVKVDYALNERNHLSGRYSWQRVLTFQAPAFGPFVGGPAGGGFQGTGNQRAYSTGINYDHVFSPTLFTELRFGIAHLHNDAQPSDYGSNDATAAGVPGVNISPFTSGQVGVTVGNLSAPVIGYAASMPWIRAEANIDLVNNWTKTIRNHSIKFGGDLRRVRDDLLQGQTYSPRGAYTFGENQTATFTNAGGKTVGTNTNIANDMASFLLDLPNLAGRDLTTYFPAYRQWWVFAFASDKWQVTPRLTVDLGVRWEFYPPATPRKNGGFSNYDQTTNSLVIAGVGGNPSNLGLKTHYDYFAPRTGFSFRATDNTVIRGGFGISYAPFPDNTYAYNYPIRANNSYQVGTTYGPALLSDGTTATFQSGFPTPIPVTVPANGIIPISRATPQLNSQQYNIIPKTFYNPYVESWNVAVQQAFPGDLSFQLAYVANHGVHMPVNQDINNPSTLGGGVTSKPLYQLFGRTAATNLVFAGFSSNYQSLQAQLTRRFSKGLSLTSAYTWSKTLNYQNGDDGGLLFFAQLHRNYAPADFERRHNFEQSFTYELPVGRGHRFLSSGPLQIALGGWKASGIVSIVSGNPFTIGANGGSLNTPGTTQTANLTGTYRVLHGIGPNKPWFDPTVFSPPSGIAVGNTGRDQFYGPGYVQDNLSLFKSFPIFREASLETRIDAFQLSNTPQFANPNTGITPSSTSAPGAFGSGAFGTITNTLGSGQGSVNGVGGGRTLQASAKISF
jgi:hypothetical protein